MSINTDAVGAVKLSAISVGSSLATIPLEETTQIGQIVAIVVSIISGISSLIKLFKKRK